MKKTKEKSYEKMPIQNPRAAGIDVGSREHYVATGQGKEHVKIYGVYTNELEELCKWLVSEGITTVALESTGNYWKNLFIMLQHYGLNPILVNGSFTKNLKGRKTDVLDCQFIQRMHSLGLLPDSFQPDDFTAQLRNIVRHRSTLLSQVADNTKRIQQSLRLMNLRLDIAVTDITGVSGMKIIRAILAGERNAVALSELCHGRVKKTKQEIEQALNGFYRQDYLFQLKQLVSTYDFLQQQILEADKELNAMIDKHLSDTNKNELVFDRSKNVKKKSRRTPPDLTLMKNRFNYLTE